MYIQLYIVLSYIPNGTSLVVLMMVNSTGQSMAYSMISKWPERSFLEILGSCLAKSCLGQHMRL